MSIDIRNLSIRYKTVQRAAAPEGARAGQGANGAADACLSADKAGEADGWRVDIRRQGSALAEQQRER